MRTLGAIAVTILFLLVAYALSTIGGMPTIAFFVLGVVFGVVIAIVVLDEVYE